MHDFAQAVVSLTFPICGMGGCSVSHKLVAGTACTGGGTQGSEGYHQTGVKARPPEVRAQRDRKLLATMRLNNSGSSQTLTCLKD